MVSTAPHHTPVVRRDGQMQQFVEPDWLERFAVAYICEVQAWTSSVINDRPEGPTAWDGYLTLSAALAGAKSIETGAPVQVDLPESPALYEQPAQASLLSRSGTSVRRRPASGTAPPSRAHGPLPVRPARRNEAAAPRPLAAVGRRQQHGRSRPTAHAPP